MKPTILFDARLCVRCKRCQIECAVNRNSKSGNLYEAIFETPAPQSNIQMKARGNVVAASNCRHCEGDEAYCIANCPTGALFRDSETNLVLQDEEKCIYCGNCVVVCPYGAPRVKVEKKQKRFFKCDLCHDRLKDGEQPYCVAACHTHALTYKVLGDGEQVEPAAASLAELDQKLAADPVQANLRQGTASGEVQP